MIYLHLWWSCLQYLPTFPNIYFISSNIYPIFPIFTQFSPYLPNFPQYLPFFFFHFQEMHLHPWSPLLLPWALRRQVIPSQYSYLFLCVFVFVYFFIFICVIVFTFQMLDHHCFFLGGCMISSYEILFNHAGHTWLYLVMVIIGWFILS